MLLFKNKYKIQSNRLQNWDYSSEGIYFITLATYNRENIFDSIDSDLMILNDNGKIIESIKIRDNWIFHNWIVMPNHIHLLIEIQNNDIQTADIQSTDTQSVETHRSASTSSTSNNTETNIAKTHCATQKTLVSRTSIRQSNYHDHIVRNYNSFEKNRFLYNQ